MLHQRSGICRRTVVTHLLVTIAALGTAVDANAQKTDYPQSPITLIVPFPAGSVTDNQMRALAQDASRQLGQPIIVLNKPGVTGTLGPSAMAKTAKPDGYTISAIPSSLVSLPHMQKVAYNPLKDFSYIVGVTGYSFALVVRKDAPWKTLDDYIQQARAQPGVLSFASSGIGGGTHLAMAQFASCEKIDLNHITFKGGADATVALIGGHVASQADGAWGPLADSGQARPLLMLTPHRVAEYPDVPTLKERCPSVTVDAQVIGIAGPAGMAPEVIRKLHDAFKGAMNDPTFIAALKSAKQQPIYLGTREYTDYMSNAFVEKGRLMKSIGLTAE